MDYEKILTQARDYIGEKISVRLLEDSISDERSNQTDQIRQLSVFREGHSEIQSSLKTEIERFKVLSGDLRSGPAHDSFWSFLPWSKTSQNSRRSVEDALRRQFETSMYRMREAADFADRLEAARVDLYDEIDRLNQKIINASKNEEMAAEFVFELREVETSLEIKMSTLDPTSTESRTLQAQLDRTRRLLAEHTMKFRLYNTAEDRLDKLRENTRQLVDMIGHLQSDITRYVTAASEKLDLVSGQIQAIGAAADAASVMLELRESLQVMTESMNHATRFVAETQQYFRENVDAMIGELDLYDEETEVALEFANAHNTALDELDVDAVLEDFEKDEILAAKIEALVPIKNG